MNAQQLKNAILQEAIEGRLVPQDPNDEPASALLARIRQEKEQLVKAGKLKKKDLEVKPISEDEIPFEIPDSWEWCRVGDLFIHASGKQQSSNNKNVGTLQKYITTSNLYWGKFVLDTLKEMYFTDEELKTCSAQKGDLLVCEGGAGYGRSAIWPYEYNICLQNHVHRLRPLIDGMCEYIYYLIYLLKESNRLASVGTAMPGLSANRLKELLVPLPPLAEQKRIVAKIEELLPKVEEYGKAQEKLNKLNEELPDRLKKSVLQEAIEGRLVPQDPNDEPASVLLQRIREEKKRLYKAGLLKKKEIVDREINEDETPFLLPDGWLWTKIDNVAFVTKLAGFEYTKYIANNLVSKENSIPLFKGKNVQNGEIIYEFEAYIPVELSNELKRSQISKKCLLTPYVGTIGNIGIHDKKGIYHLGSNVGKIEFYNSDSLNILEEYVKYYLMSNYGYNELTKYKKATAQESISIEAIRDVFIPLPPLAEQKRIVAKIEEVFSEIDKMKK